MIIYEVNCLVNKNIEGEFLSWLKLHAQEISSLEGFLSAETYQLLEDERLLEQPGCTGMSIEYRLESQDALDHYLSHHAPRLRQEGIDRFGDQFTAYRRVMIPVS